MREFLEIMLRRDGYDVESAESGAIALEKIEKLSTQDTLRAIRHELLLEVGARLKDHRDRKLLEWLGESWDESCLDFHALRNSVKTAAIPRPPNTTQPIEARASEA